jgi:hypothetical protein
MTDPSEGYVATRAVPARAVVDPKRRAPNRRGHKGRWHWFAPQPPRPRRDDQVRV